MGICNSITNTYMTLGMVFEATDRLDEAEKAYTQSHKYATLAGDDGLKSRALSGLAGLARRRGQFSLAAELLEEALKLARNRGMSWDIAIGTTQLGHLALQEHKLTLAKGRYQEALTLFKNLSSPTYCAGCLAGFAATISEQGYYAKAVRLSAAATALYEQAQIRPQGGESERLEQLVTTAKGALGEETFMQEWKVGNILTYNEAIDAALSDEWKLGQGHMLLLSKP